MIAKGTLKKGDEIFLIESRNSAKKLEGKVLVIISLNGNNNHSFQVKCKDTGVLATIYNGGPADEYIAATKEAKIEYYTVKLKDADDEVIRIKAELEFIEKYDSMEEFVADKIGLLIKADTKESRVEILRTLKQTNYL